MAVSDPPLEETKTKIFKTRIKQRRDTSANWESKNPVLLNGEVIIVDTANGETRTKTGDGTKTYTQLPFDDEGSKGGKSLIDKSFADNVSTSGNTTTIDKQLKTYSVTTRLEADVVITGLDENGQEVTRHKLSEKVDKVSGKSLIDENVSKQIAYNPNDKYVHVDFKSTKGSGIDCSGIKIQKLSREDSSSDYETSEVAPYTELSGSTIRLQTPDNEATVELSTTGFTIDNNKEQSSPSILLGTKAGDIIVHNYTTNEQHKLSEKANSSDVLKKTNTAAFTPTADYHPATKKYVDDNKLSHIANGETIGTIKIGRTGSQRADGPYSTIIGFGGHTSNDALGSVAIGNGECLADYTVAMGLTVANGENQLVFGKYNVKDTENKYACIIGNGTSDTARSNAHTVDWNGNAWFAGDVEGVKNGTTHKLSEKVSFGDNYNTSAAGASDVPITLHGITEGASNSNKPIGIKFNPGAGGGSTASITVGCDNSTDTATLSYNGLSIKSTAQYSAPDVRLTPLGLQTVNGSDMTQVKAGSVKCSVDNGNTWHELSEKAEAKTYTVSVPTTSWTEKTDTDNQKYYYKKITVSGMTANGQAMTDVAMSDSVAAARKQMEAYQCVNRVVTGNGYVELYCFDEAPTTAFTLRILVISNILS